MFSRCQQPRFRVTQSFKLFLEAHVPSLAERPEIKNIIYKVRSGLAHGVADPLRADVTPWMLFEDPEQSYQEMLQQELMDCTSEAIVNGATRCRARVSLWRKEVAKVSFADLELLTTTSWVAAHLRQQSSPILRYTWRSLIALPASKNPRQRGRQRGLNAGQYSLGKWITLFAKYSVISSSGKSVYSISLVNTMLPLPSSHVSVAVRSGCTASFQT